MPFHLGGPELIIILVVVLIIFGVGRLSEVGGAMGRGIREFRKNLMGEDEKPSAVARTEEQPEKKA
jgi:sec-independent protein translocase protein TatA